MHYRVIKCMDLWFRKNRGNRIALPFINWLINCIHPFCFVRNSRSSRVSGRTIAVVTPSIIRFTRVYLGYAVTSHLCPALLFIYFKFLGEWKGALMLCLCWFASPWSLTDLRLRVAPSENMLVPLQACACQGWLVGCIQWRTERIDQLLPWLRCPYKVLWFSSRMFLPHSRPALHVVPHYSSWLLF